MIPDVDAFLARLTAELEQISVQQHALARRQALLREARVQLGTGSAVEIVEARLRAGLSEKMAK